MNRIYLHMDGVHRVAGQCVAVDTALQIDIVIEGHAGRQAAAQIDGGIYWQFDLQVQGVVLCDEASSVKYRVGVETCAVVFLIVVAPYERCV